MFVEAIDASYRSTDLVFLRWMVLYKPSPLNTTIMSCLNLTPDQVWHVLPSLCDVLSLLGKGRVTFGKRKTKRRINFLQILWKWRICFHRYISIVTIICQWKEFLYHKMTISKQEAITSNWRIHGKHWKSEVLVSEE